MTEFQAADLFRKEALERTLDETEGVRLWYEECLRRLGEMTVEDAPLTNSVEWKATMTEGGEVEEVDGAHFTLIGQTVTRYNPDGTIAFRWTQPGLLQKESTVTIPTTEGVREITASGFVGIILDEEDNVLLTLAQEPFAQTPKKALIRTPFQASIAKLDGILKGDRKLDPTLSDLLTVFGGGDDILKVFASGQVDLFPLPDTDANRIGAGNVGFALRITNPDLRDSLTGNGENRWFTPPEVSYITRAGLINGHTANAYLASKSSF